METKQSSTDGTEHGTLPAGSGGGTWLFPAFLAIVLLILLAITRWAPDPTPGAGSPSAWIPSPKPLGQTVSLSIDFGNGATKEFAALPWRAEMTVAELLEVARDYRPGIEFTQIGAGTSGFLGSLDRLANEGAGGRNWIYQVDGQHAHTSFCLEKLVPGRHVLWTFTDERYNAE